MLKSWKWLFFLFSICERLPVPDYFLSGHRTSTCSWICRLQPLFEMSLAQFNLLHHFWIGFFPPLISIWIFFSKGFVFILNMSYNIWYFDFSYYILSKLLKSCQVWTHMNLPMKHLMFCFLRFIPLCLTWCQKFNKWWAGPAGRGHALLLVMHILSDKQLNMFYFNVKRSP